MFEVGWLANLGLLFIQDFQDEKGTFCNLQSLAINLAKSFEMAFWLTSIVS